MIPAMFLAVATLATAVSWRQIGIGPPESVAPKAALDYVRKAGITGNVFNSYAFGGYLIFEGVPVFIDGRALPYGDDLFHEYLDTINLADIKAPFQLLDRYKAVWALLRPTEPLAKALANSNLWDEVYSDKYSVAFVRHQ